MADGKKSGKINIIDLLVILIIVAAVAAVGLKLSGKLGGKEESVGTDITYTVWVENIDQRAYQAAADSIAAAQAAGYPGDQLMANGKLVDGYITGVTAQARSDEAVVQTSTGGISVYAGQKDRVDLTFEIQAHVEDNIKTEVGTQEVRAGKPHIVKTTHFEFLYGTILTCQWAGGTGVGY